jgi:hypothetical protein
VTDHADAVYADPATGVVRLHRRTPEAAQEYLTAELVRALAENAMLADALGRATHRFVDCRDCGGTACGCDADDPGDPNVVCGQPPAAPVHRTPGVVRAELDALGTPPDTATLARLRDALATIGDQA